MPIAFSDLKPGDTLHHPYYGDSISVTDLSPLRVFLSGKHEMSFYAGEFDRLGFERDTPAPVEDQLPARRYKRLPLKHKDDDKGHDNGRDKGPDKGHDKGHDKGKEMTA